jgi:hypothetical protein
MVEGCHNEHDRQAQRERVRALFDGYDFTEIRSNCPASGQ